MTHHPSNFCMWGDVCHVKLDPRLPLFLIHVEKIGEPSDKARVFRQYIFSVCSIVQCPFLSCQQEAIDCVREMKSPGKMNFLVSEAINHSLEKSVQHRKFSGRLFNRLLKEHLITKPKFMEG